MTAELFHQYRFVVVIAMLAMAVSLTTVRGRTPLALRGLRRMLRQDEGSAGGVREDASAPVAAWRRLLALLLVLASFFVAVAL